ncbi:hypothetical protein U3516DRAFT_749268 [Neocallimastix sp. 'constans']
MSECQKHNYVQFLEFLEYFISYETENWNYYDNIVHITNNKNLNITLIMKA